MHLGVADTEVRYTFSGHESFPFRYSWIAKGVQRSLEDPALFVRDDATVVLGVGKNMVRSIRYWCSAMGLLTSPRVGRVEVTELGRMLFGPDGLDPYLEDAGTLWLLHWLLVRDPDLASTWHLAFTRFTHDSFTRQQLVEFLLDITAAESPMTRVTETSMRRDVDVFVRTYAQSASSRSVAALEESYDCPLVELGLLEEDPTGVVSFVHGAHPSLPDEIFAFALADYWERTRPHLRTLSLEDVLYSPGSPGAAFKLTENALVELLERLPEWTGLRFDETAGRRLLLRTNNTSGEGVDSSLTILRTYYEAEGEE